MTIDRHFHDVVTITHNCCVIVATTVNRATSVRASHSPCLGATVGMICVVFVYWLTGCFLHTYMSLLLLLRRGIINVFDGRMSQPPTPSYSNFDSLQQ